ncbi:MAG TPA: FAD-dependent monooxygenase, partial [Polyangiales bacterium]|nr:FAD-dependent monooxygenase [Polyangiales bacterium]
MRVLISGAGIAGPALAWWLARYGVQSVVVERSADLRVGGHAIDIRGVALDVVEHMGVMEEVRRAKTELRTLSFVRGAGKGTIDIPIARAMAGRRDLEIVRDDLSRILYEASRQDAEYIFGDAIAKLEPSSSKVKVTFESGTTRTFDVVVGADGQHSVTRRLAFGPEATFTRRFGAYLSIFGIPNLFDLEDRVLLYNEPGRAAASYSTVGNRSAKALLLLRSTRPYEELREEAAQKRFLAEAFRDAGWETRRLIDALATCSDFYFDEIAQIHMPRWSEGRVVLLGDAAHGPSPLSGQGTSLALVGALVLADALVTHSQPSAAFAAYEAHMRPFVKANQELADNGLRTLIPDSMFFIHFRNAVARVVPLLMRLGVRMDRSIQRAAHA